MNAEGCGEVRTCLRQFRDEVATDCLACLALIYSRWFSRSGRSSASSSPTHPRSDINSRRLFTHKSHYMVFFFVSSAARGNAGKSILGRGEMGQERERERDS